MEQANDDSSPDEDEESITLVIDEDEEDKKSSWEEDGSSSSESENDSNKETESSATEESVSEETITITDELCKKETHHESEKETLSTDALADENTIANNKKRNIQDDGKYWETNPEIYGIRRSARARKEPERLNTKKDGTIGSDDSDSDGGKMQRRKKTKRRKRLSSDNIPTLTSESDSESSRDSLPKQKVRPTQRKSTKHSSFKSSITKSGKSTLPIVSDEDSKERSQRSRRRTTNIKYKEHSDQSTDEEDIIEQKDEKVDLYADAETIEKVLMHKHGRPGITGAMTTVYAVEAADLKSQGDPDPSKEATEVQYLIKWKDWAHIHNTWESETSLEEQHVRGLKKLSNYMKRLEEIEKWKMIATPEDVEYFQCQLELHQEIYCDYKIVERIIAHQYTGDGKTSSYPDYLCKWLGLPYSSSSWEDGALIARFYQDSIDCHLKRENSDKIPSRTAKVLKQRPKFVPLKSQPSYIGNELDHLELRNYQLDGVNWLIHAWIKENSVILADEMGLGKTIQAISFLSILSNGHSLYGPFLVVVPLSTMAAWQKEFQLWSPDMNVVVYIGDVNSRTKIQECEWCFKNRRLKFNVILTTYEMLLKDKELLGSIYWAVVVVDEAHRLKNDDSLLYRSMVDFRTNYRLLITGTPLQNSLKELWSLLHFMMPDRFSSFEDFELKYSAKEINGYQNLHRELEPFLIRRVKKDVEKSLPAKIEQILRVEMSTVQKQYYKWILTKNFRELNKGLKGKAANGFLNIVVELKKTCNHANLIRPVEATPAQDALQTLIRGSGKMILLDKLLTRLKERGSRVLIFSQMVRMLDILAEYLKLNRFLFQRLDGSIRGDLRKQALDHFNAEGSMDFCFLLSTRAGGLGVNLATADTVIIFDSDWNPQNDLQAMARAHRIGQRRQVKIYRLVTKGSIEEDIIERAKKKMVLDHLIIQRMDTTGKKVLSKMSYAPSTTTPFNKEELAAILKFGAQELFKDTDGEDDEKLQKMDIDAILDSAEINESEDHHPTMGEELLSQFKVANFGTFEEDEELIKSPIPDDSKPEESWEDIIPEKDRKKLAEEEEHLKRMELFLPPRKRKKVEKMDLDDFEPEIEKKLKKSRRRTHTDSSSADESAAENEDKPKRKRGRPRTVKKDDIKGFNDIEIRRFVKSFKKFARPMTRLDTIAADAELQEKSMTDINRLANLLHSGCEQAVKDYQEKLLQDPNFDGKKRGASLKLSGITINAPSFFKSEEELEPLPLCLPENVDERLRYRLAMPTRNVHWGIKWDVLDDSMLLVGMYQYGVGSWEAIKNDQTLGLTAKILPPGDGKPQDKHLQSRAEYLLKLLKLHCNESKKVVERKATAKVKRMVQNDVNRSSGSSIISSSISESAPTTAIKCETHEDPVLHHSESSLDKAPEPEIKSGKPKKEKSKETEKKEHKKEKLKHKSSNKPMKNYDESLQAGLEDGSSQSGLAVTEVANMSQSTFSACKDKMRPVKKALRMLENPEEKVDEKDQVSHTRQCLLKIGDHIQKCLNEYEDADVAKEWRSNFWTFVSKFTAFDARKLFKLYRIACRKREDQREEKRKHHTSEKPSAIQPSQTTQSECKQHPPNWLQLDEVRKRTLGISSPSTGGKIPKIEKVTNAEKDRDYRRQGDHIRSPGSSNLENNSDHRTYNRDRDNRRGGHSPHRRSTEDLTRYPHEKVHEKDNEKGHFRDHHHRPDDWSRYEGNRHGSTSRGHRDYDRDDRRRSSNDHPKDSKWNPGFHRQYSSHYSADRYQGKEQDGSRVREQVYQGKDQDDSSVREQLKDDPQSRSNTASGHYGLTNNPSPTKSHTNYWERGTSSKSTVEHGHKYDHGHKQDVKISKRNSPDKSKLPIVTHDHK